MASVSYGVRASVEGLGYRVQGLWFAVWALEKSSCHVLVVFVASFRSASSMKNAFLLDCSVRLVTSVVIFSAACTTLFVMLWLHDALHVSTRILSIGFLPGFVFRNSANVATVVLLMSHATCTAVSRAFVTPIPATATLATANLHCCCCCCCWVYG